MSLTELSIYHLHIPYTFSLMEISAWVTYIHTMQCSSKLLLVTELSILKRLAILNITTINRFQLDTCFI